MTALVDASSSDNLISENLLNSLPQNIKIKSSSTVENGVGIGCINDFIECVLLKFQISGFTLYH